MTPTPQDVANYLGRGEDATILALAGEHLPVVEQMVRAYVRDNGFDDPGNQPRDDLAAVIVSSCARLVSNPEHNVSVQLAGYSVRPGIFNGWTLPELAILHRYRKRAL